MANAVVRCKLCRRLTPYNLPTCLACLTKIQLKADKVVTQDSKKVTK